MNETAGGIWLLSSGSCFCSYSTSLFPQVFFFVYMQYMQYRFRVITYVIGSVVLFYELKGSNPRLNN